MIWECSVNGLFTKVWAGCRERKGIDSTGPEAAGALLVIQALSLQGKRGRCNWDAEERVKWKKPSWESSSDLWLRWTREAATKGPHHPSSLSISGGRRKVPHGWEFKQEPEIKRPHWWLHTCISILLKQKTGQKEKGKRKIPGTGVAGNYVKTGSLTSWL